MNPRPFVFLFAPALLALGTIGAACDGGNGNDVNGGGVRHYENAELGFALDYHNDWEQVKEPLRAAEEIGEADTLASVLLGRLLEDPLHLEGVGVTVYRHRSTPEEDVEEALLELDDLIAQLMGQAGGAIAEADWTELGGVIARRYVLNFPHPVGVPMTSEKVVTFRGDLQFELDCQAVADRFQDVEAECQVVLDSFEFTPELLISDDAEDTVNTTLIEFIVDAKAGNIESVEVDAAGNLWYKLINDPEQTFKTKMEEGDSVRQILEDAGIAPEDFPPIRPK